MAKIEVTEEITQQVAKLAHLELTNAEIKLFTQQLSEIIQYVDQLSAVGKLEGVKPLLQPIEMPLFMRPDEVKKFEPTDHLPNTQGYSVPAVL